MHANLPTALALLRRPARQMRPLIARTMGAERQRSAARLTERELADHAVDTGP
jgi:hypothetical protein